MIGVLHIGAEKTGTTTLQEYCLLNRDRFAKAGVLFPQTPGVGQHWLLAVYAMDDARENQQIRQMASTMAQGRAAWRADFASRLGAEIEANPADRLLISTEMFHSQLTSTEEVERLKGLLDTWCDQYRIIFYMRRQDRAQVSRYSTHLRHGGTPASIFGPTPIPGYHRDLYDYARILERWASVFGHESIIPRVFEPSALHDGDLIADFLQAGQLPADPAARLSERHNEALSSTAQQFLLAYNDSSAKAGILPESRYSQLQRAVVSFIEQACPGTPALPACAEAMAFHAAFQESNLQVAREWFDRDQLFDENFSDYPEDASPVSGPDARETMDLSARLIQFLMANSVWLDVTRLDRLASLESGQDMQRILAEYVSERSPELSERLAALRVLQPVDHTDDTSTDATDAPDATDERRWWSRWWGGSGPSS